MENQDKLYKEFKEAADKAETKGFDHMEAVWNRVEEKLDEKNKRRPVLYFKYGSVAALLLLCLTVGTFIFRKNDSQPVAPNALPENNVTVIDTQKVKDAFDPTKVEKVEAVVANEKSVNPLYDEPENKEALGDSINFNFKTKKALIYQSSTNGWTINTRRNTDDVKYYKGRNQESEELLEERTNTGTLQSLQGQVAGLQISTGSNPPGTAQPYVQTDLQKRYSGNTNIVLKGKSVAEQSGYFNPTKDKNYDALANGRVINRALPESIAQRQSGSDSTILLRGVGSINANTEPLIIVDGIPINEDNFRNINPNDIKNIKVLKNTEATSLYGNRGSQGVVLVELKAGKAFKSKQGFFKRLFGKREKQAETSTIDTQPTTRFIPIDTEEYEAFEENKFENPATTPLSTFSIDVDNASYTNVRRFLNNGQTVPKDAVRVEEMINFFKYKYNQPTLGTPFSLNTELSDAPWNPKHKLLKIGLQGKDIPQAELAASNFVFLIDVSGSMNDTNKLPLLKQSMKLLVNQMREQDRLAIVVYAGAAGLVLPSTSGAEKNKLIAALDNLSAGGSTAGGAGIELAYKTAQEHFIKGGNNRVILATDGDFNVGASSNTDMQTLIEEKRKSGVFLTCLGYGMGNYKDSKMEILADKGNGNYAYIDNMQEATRFLDKEFKGSMYAIAKDVKIQIEFNPKHVQSYRLIGYENRKLRDEDFANDAVDAGELGSGHTVTALYEIIPTGVKSDYFTAAPELKYSTPQTATGNYADELATIKFRYKKPDEDKSKEVVKVIPIVTVPLKNATPDFKFAASVAWFGLKLRDSKLIPNKETEAIKKLAGEGLQNDPEGYRAEFVRLVDMVK